MDGIHDLGGMEGFGRLPIEEDEPVFHHDWEGRTIGMRLLMSFWGKWNIDTGRHSVERLRPDEYLTMSYYEKWLASLVILSTEAGLVSREEIASGSCGAGLNSGNASCGCPGLYRIHAQGQAELARGE